MRKTLLAAIAIAALSALALPAQAQTVPSSVTLNWTLPALNTDGSAIPASGSTALAKVQVWLATSSIADAASSTAPTAEVTPVGVTTTQTLTAPTGGAVFARIRVCNAAGVCGALSSEVSKPVAIPIPGVPTNVTLTIKVGP